MKRRLAVTAATAAIAVSPAAAATPKNARAPLGGKARVSRLAEARSGQAQQALDAMRNAELRAHRHELATALAAELPSAAAPAVERGLAEAEAQPAAFTEVIAHSTGASEQQVEAAFEAMSRHALARRLRA